MYVVVLAERKLEEGEQFDTLCNAVDYLNSHNIEGRVYYCYRDATGKLHVSHMVYNKEYNYVVS